MSESRKELNENLEDAIRFACSSKNIVTFGLPCNEKFLEHLLSEGFIVKNSVKDYAILLDKNTAETKDIITYQLNNGIKIDNPSHYAIMGIDGKDYGKMKKRIEEQNRKIQKTSEEEPSSNVTTRDPTWDYVLDRIILYQSRILSPLNIKGYFSLDDGIIIENKKFNPNSIWIGN